VKTDDEVKEAQAGPNLQRGMDVARTWQPPDKRISLGLLIGLILLLGLSGGWQLLVIVISIVVMITLHELGHFLTAKWSGMKVTEFFLGFGPKLWSTTRGETEYGVKAIPAGAYVRIIGMNNLEEVPPEDEALTYRQQSYPKRMLVVCAGSGMHFLLAILCLFMMLTVTGSPGGRVFYDPPRPFKVDAVTVGGAAANAGLQAGDTIVSVDGVAVPTADELKAALRARIGQPVALVFEHQGERREATTTLGNDVNKGLLGIQLEELALPSKRVNPVVAAGRSVTEFGTGVKLSIQAIGSLFSPSGISDFVGDVRRGGSPTVNDNPGSGSAPSSGPAVDEHRPVSIIGATRIGTGLLSDGLFGFLAFFMTINMFIGIVNLAPLLPLDGGHAAIATYERIRSRKGRRYQVDVAKLLPMTYAVVMILVLLFVSTVFLDIVDPISIN
jgi:membrane-associated protease RseP (regulator of RpoE activity)